MTANTQVAATVPAGDVRVAAAARAVRELAAILETYRIRMERVAAARARIALILQRQGFTYEELTTVFGMSRTVTARLISRAREDERSLSAGDLATVTAISTAALASAMNDERNAS